MLRLVYDLIVNSLSEIDLSTDDGKYEIILGDIYEPDLSYDEFIDGVVEKIKKMNVIYHKSAIEFLKDNDPNLIESLEKAEELGYTPKQLNSELLANLLLQDIMMNKLDEVKDEIEKIFGDVSKEV